MLRLERDRRKGRSNCEGEGIRDGRRSVRVRDEKEERWGRKAVRWCDQSECYHLFGSTVEGVINHPRLVVPSLPHRFVESLPSSLKGRRQILHFSLFSIKFL